MFDYAIQTAIENEVAHLISARQMFTAGEVIDYVKQNFNVEHFQYEMLKNFVHQQWHEKKMGIGYHRTSVVFENAQHDEVSAWVYHPHFADPFTYVSHEIAGSKKITPPVVGRMAVDEPEVDSGPAGSCSKTSLITGDDLPTATKIPPKTSLVSWDSLDVWDDLPTATKIPPKTGLVSWDSLDVPLPTPAAQTTMPPVPDSVKPIAFASQKAPVAGTTIFTPAGPLTTPSPKPMVDLDDDAKILYSVDEKGRIVISRDYTDKITTQPRGTVYLITERKRLTIVADGDSHPGRVTILKLDRYFQLRITPSMLRAAGIPGPTYSITHEDDALYITQAK